MKLEPVTAMLIDALPTVAVAGLSELKVGTGFEDEEPGGVDDVGGDDGSVGVLLFEQPKRPNEPKTMQAKSETEERERISLKCSELYC
ncbi:hypothetical protein [Tunturiibacter gelidoferens]|uniref:Uncharacterized protein n=1 Tax=Tunturiibacter lichenicola TaxID=2051959 RepID=A0A7Y9NNL9_9BACT|nr:hypothetical protein [Edaphobacter lichenicola]NYF52699.1 hypothetical protein [Edaphobacter lichenicola]